MKTNRIIKLHLIEILVLLFILTVLRFIGFGEITVWLVITVVTIKIISSVNAMVIDVWRQKDEYNSGVGLMHHKRMSKTFIEFHNSKEEE